MSNFTIKETADMARVSVRTLHHYDQIGLLKPAHIGANMYRYYGKAQQLRLQQIMFYREFGMGLAEIGQLLDNPAFDPLDALQNHKIKLTDQMKHHRTLMATIDRTIAEIKGDRKMNAQDLYKGFSKEKQAEHEAKLSSQSPEMAANVKIGKMHNAKKSKSDIAHDMAELERIKTALAANMTAGVAANAPTNADLLKRHRIWVSGMWGRECSAQAHVGLAQMYEASPEFRERYELIGAGFTAYLCAAIRAYSDIRT